MKKIAVSLISIVIVSMMLFAVVPVMAKPNTISVSVRSGSSKSVVGYTIHVFRESGGPLDLGNKQIEHGHRVTFDLSAYDVYSGNTFTVRVYNLAGTLVGQNTVSLNSKLSGSISMKVEYI
jgi:hypothetical protein